MSLDCAPWRSSPLNGVRSEMGGLRAGMNARFETVGVRMDSLDRYVQAVASRVFGTDRPRARDHTP